MRTIRAILAVLLCTALLAALCACGRQPDGAAIDADAVVLTVGDVPVYALTYRYQLDARCDTIVKNNLFDRDTYLSYVVNPSVRYSYPYFDTRTEEGLAALKADVLKGLAYEAAAIYAAGQAGYSLSIEDQYYIELARQDALNAVEELAETYGSAEAFYAATGFDEESFARMYTQNREASIDFNKVLEAFRQSYTLEEPEIEQGYARIVKETFQDRYADGVYSQYLAYYLSGARSFPSLYIPDDAIFVRLFVHTDPNEEQIAAYTALAAADFNALYIDADNEFTAQGTAGDLAIAPRDSLVEGLYDAAKDVPIGETGAMTVEQDGKTVFYLFLRVEGETGVVPIDRYPGVRETVVRQIIGARCMESLLAYVDDPAITVRNDALLAAIEPEMQQGS